ncbi:hypothetical protein HII31_03129 [Pseudocercospora fuligena]|uniref:DUF7587 domain-containing protein n=1 Tax=Pseudocercospora fuligena TaxID=685502 RepID=A0A8H6VKY0_9PEZI|nr:hypothetical protein HII31_03129 [Pseudocercospora fuligena]
MSASTEQKLPDSVKDSRSVGLLHPCTSTAPSRPATARIDMSPKWLFRAYSNQSQGINTSTLFAPKAALKNPRHYRRPDFEDTDKAAELELALKWSEKSNHFVFFSNSLLFALAVAAYRDTRNESGINVVCVDTDRVRTLSGQKVVFENAASTFKTSNHAGIKNSNGSHRDYSDVFVATECVDLERGSWTASYIALKERGLHALFPRYAPQLDRFGMERRPRLNIVVEDMRAYGFKGVHSLTAGRIDTMAALASAFKRTAGQHTTFPMHLLVAFLAFKETDPLGRALQSWLGQRCQAIIFLDDGESDLEVEREKEDFCLPPEVVLQVKMMKTLSHFQIGDSSAVPRRALSDADIREEKQAWETWIWQKRKRRQLQHGDNGRGPRRDYQKFHSRERWGVAKSGPESRDGSERGDATQRLAKRMSYTSSNEGSSAENAILLDDSDKEGEDPVSLPLDPSLQQTPVSQDRYSNGQRYAKKRRRRDDHYDDRLRNGQKFNSRKRRRHANER